MKLTSGILELTLGGGSAALAVINENSRAILSLRRPPVQDLVSSFQRDPFVRFPVPANNEVHALFGHCRYPSPVIRPCCIPDASCMEFFSSVWCMTQIW